jgi:teichoic acid transport system ATP-binding protein
MKEHMAGVTKLLVTHDMVSVAQLATRAVVIERGRKVFDGEPHAAIEHYTKAAHTEAFSKSAPASSTREAEAPSLPTSTSLRAIPESSLGGGRELDICAFSVTVDDAPVELVRAGERVVVAMALFAKRSFDSVIVGVTVSDKYGQAIFGVNSLGSGHDSLAIRVAGGLRVELSFVWPEIKEGTYLLTLGVGEGVEELSHVVQCWAHNVTSVAALPGRAVHGIFNVHMDEVSLSPTTGEH